MRTFIHGVGNNVHKLSTLSLIQAKANSIQSHEMLSISSLYELIQTDSGGYYLYL